MGVAQSTDLNTDSSGRFTTGEYGDRGDGVSSWFMRHRIANGGDAALGATTDAAVTTGDSTLISIMKGIRGFFKQEDNAHVSGDFGMPVLGYRNDAFAAMTSATGDYGNIAVGPGGEALTCLVPPQGQVLGAAVSLTEAATTALATNLVVKNATGTLYRISGINNNAAVRYLQIHNTASLPADGVVPALVFAIPATSNFSFDWGVYGRRFATGITVCLSTTLATKTIAAADMWLNASYK